MAVSPPTQTPAQGMQAIELQRQQVSATLAAAIVGNMKRPVSIDLVLSIYHEVYFAMNPSTTGHYQEWVKTREEKLAKVWD